MKFIGITGGVGAGKSAVLKYLSEKENIRVMLADEIAHDLMKQGTRCYKKIMKAFMYDNILDPSGEFDRGKLAKVIFSSDEKRLKMNSIVHPAVKEYVKEQLALERGKGELDFLVLEAALLIEDHYNEVCDELWYIYASPEVRRERLMTTRGYSEEKVQQIFDSQLPEEVYREKCKVTIDNDGDLSETFLQIDKALKDEAKENVIGMEQPFVFGLDIGTRNVVGTVGYQEDEHSFIIQAQCIMEHETRAMIDGQIHDIGRVSRTIAKVKEKLEEQIKQLLTDVCIAAAGRVLKTITVTVEYEYPEETVVAPEDIHTLDLLGIEKAQNLLKEQNDTQYKFYCVGYTVVKYYLNDETFSNIEGHKANKISEDIIVTFLPEDVVDGLYSAVGQAGLTVASLTLEPIAAINIAIPESFRMLNIALVDIGAGTSDISVTKDGSITAYGMIPLAGDELTELIVQQYLVDFKTAEYIKLASSEQEEITYKDIMMIEHTIPAEDVWNLTAPTVDRMTTAVAAKIKELNGDKSVSAAFIVGGGGKIHGYTESLAEKLGIISERVALRGEEVLQEVTFLQPDIKKDPLLVTPIGICINYYQQKNSFIMVRLNGERVKLYNNNKLTIVDAALQAGFSNEDLFPRRGKEIHYNINGVDKVERGVAGESAVITMNGKPAGMSTRLEPNSEIEIQLSTQGEDAVLRIEKLDEYRGQQVTFIVNGTRVTCPKCVEVNGELKPGAYEIQDGDVIEIRSYYTVEQIAEFMDVEVDMTEDVFVNNRSVDMDTRVYDNFTLDWTTLAYAVAEEQTAEEAGSENYGTADTEEDYGAESAGESVEAAGGAAPQQPGVTQTLQVYVNGEPVMLTGKSEYIFVDIFEFYDFDLKAGGGRGVITLLNGEDAPYIAVLKNGDQIKLAWKEN
ncbi:MAG: dephospho-CoA kinase [Roseburia sp.]|nr:dephospho-CoA kinase [Roseburia sp.]